MLGSYCAVAGVACIEPFDYSEFETKDKGTPKFLEYHQKQLEACGARMGRSGYQVHDLRDTTLYHVQVGDKRHSGGIDGGVLPFAVRVASATNMLRIGFVHKQSTEDKAVFQTKYPHAAQVRSSSTFVVSKVSIADLGSYCIDTALDVCL